MATPNVTSGALQRRLSKKSGSMGVSGVKAPGPTGGKVQLSPSNNASAGPMVKNKKGSSGRTFGHFNKGMGK